MPEQRRTGVEILDTCSWRIHHGGSNNASGGLSGQLSRCRLNGVVFYVRENLLIDHFVTSSNERVGLKRSAAAPRYPQVLELCAPAPRLWEALADAVEAADRLGRTVRRNRNFTVAWAERQFAREEGANA